MSKPTRKELDLFADILGNSEATVAVVSAEIDGESFEWSGTAKRFPGANGEPADKHNAAIGTKLALARAFRSAAAQLERQADGAVKSAADNREQSKQARAERAAQEGSDQVKVHRVRGRGRAARRA